ncbi:outer membrane beta-barrel domain-containing protein [Alteromonas facilis]|uniref:outer membrane beta-barrel domain-containing protein n=1 Tax=Alteromonas facilis TaxID=2048004 RepID=UPI000C283678|nr:outer membrane beta-barrel domain-containing protein [Alteromonas facilis]
METWRKRIFLTALQRALAGLSVCSMLLGAVPAMAQQSASATPPPIIDPALKRRTVTEANIDSEDFEVTAMVGVQSIEDFGNDVTYGVRLGYHISEHWFTEASYSMAQAGTTSFEDLSGGANFLTDDERDFTTYDLAVGYKMNGEVFLADGVAFNTNFYLLVGGGGTEFGGDERFTLTLGAGYRVLLTDYLSLRLDVRDHIFKSDLIGEEKSTHNMAYTLGVSMFF